MPLALLPSTPLSRRALLLVISLLAAALGNPLRAQQANFQQALALGRGSSGDECIPAKIQVDAAGNQYLTGRFTGTLVLGSLQLNSAGGFDIFVAKLNASGQYLWAVRAGGSGDDSGYGLALSQQGNILLTGEFRATASFGPHSVTSAGQQDAFVAKLDGAGQFLWVSAGGGADADYGSSIAVDAQENAYVAGFIFGPNVQFGATTLPLATMGDLLVTKLNAAGTFLWAASGGGPGSLSQGAGGIALDNAGNAYVTGSSNGPANFGPNVYLDNQYNEQEALMAKIDATGTWRWVVGTPKPLGISSGAASGYDVAVDHTGNAYVAGFFSGTVGMFGTSALTSQGSYDVFVAKLNPAGTLLWATRAGGIGLEIARAITVDAADNAFITGYFGGRATFGSFTVAGSGFSDAFVARLNSSGAFVGAAASNNSRHCSGSTIAVGPANTTYVAGYFNGTTAELGPSSLTGSDNKLTGFVSKAGSLTLATTSQQPASALRFQVWPNPGYGTAFVTGSGPNQPVQVYTLLGQLVVATSMPADGRLALQLPAGVYLVRSNELCHRLVIE